MASCDEALRVGRAACKANEANVLKEHRWPPPVPGAPLCLLGKGPLMQYPG